MTTDDERDALGPDGENRSEIRADFDLGGSATGVSPRSAGNRVRGFKVALEHEVVVAGLDRARLARRANLSDDTVTRAFRDDDKPPTMRTVTLMATAIGQDPKVWLARLDAALSGPDVAQDARELGAGRPHLVEAGRQPSDDEKGAQAGPTKATQTSAADPKPSAGDDQAPVAAHPVEPSRAVLADANRIEESSTEPRIGREAHPVVRPRWSRRRTVTAGVVVLVLAAGLGWWIFGRTEQPPSRTIVVQNKVAFGPTDLEEDRSPSYLAARPIEKCANVPGCKLAGTDMGSGDTVQAVCQLQGATLTNANVRSTGVQDNPNATASSLWYGIRWRDGRRGYLSEVYVAPMYRGGLGLPPC